MNRRLPHRALVLLCAAALSLSACSSGGTGASDATGSADPEVAAFIRLYQSSPAVRARIDAANAHDPKLYSLPWLD